jgi:hypothetical protein
MMYAGATFRPIELTCRGFTRIIPKRCKSDEGCLGYNPFRNETGSDTRIYDRELENFSCIVCDQVSHVSLTNFKLAAERGLITHLNGMGCLQTRVSLLQKRT